MRCSIKTQLGGGTVKDMVLQFCLLQELYGFKFHAWLCLSMHRHLMC